MHTHSTPPITQFTPTAQFTPPITHSAHRQHSSHSTPPITHSSHPQHRTPSHPETAHGHHIQVMQTFKSPLHQPRNIKTSDEMHQNTAFPHSLNLRGKSLTTCRRLSHAGTQAHHIVMLQALFHHANLSCQTCYTVITQRQSHHVTRPDSL